MRLLAFHSEKELATTITAAFVEGARVHGVDAEAVPGDYPETVDCDVAVLFGINARLRADAYHAAGVQTVMLDKGYLRHATQKEPRWCEYWRIAVNSHHPTRYLGSLKSNTKRWDKLHRNIQPWRRFGDHILIAGSSEKYHHYSELAEPTRYVKSVVKQLAALTPRRQIYRPKPSWKDAVPVKGADFMPYGDIEPLLRGAHAMVTNGSNACFEAVLAGIPVVVLGDAVARPISSMTLEEIENPRLASDAERLQWFSDLANCQWTMSEMRSGEAWQHVKGLLDVQ